MSDNEQDQSPLAKALGVTGNVTPIKKAEFSKAEEALLHSNALSPEDAMWENLSETVKQAVLTPTYSPMLLATLVQQNNTLGQCVAAMEVNVDGTGYEIERRDGEEKTDKDKKNIKDIEAFFDEPYPGESFITIRRKLRRDLEATGNAYLEVIRNPKGEITFLNYLDAKYVFMMKLDNSTTPVSRVVKRNGRDVSLKMSVRERRFAQVVGVNAVYFKEFGSTRPLDKRTGKWVDTKAGKLDPSLQASELIHFTLEEDVKTPYGVPRWINQVPSVLGSRKAEEYNLEFFNHGGVPPAMILVQGGALTTKAREALTNYLAGKAKYKQRGVLVEAYATGGDLNSAGNVRITVERFGAERQNDSMFQKYDDKCYEHVRSSFRLPPLFVGRSEEHTYANAQASYLVAEEQVFAPERREFDEIINVRVMSSIAPDYVFRSKPQTFSDSEGKMKALTLAKGVVDGESFVDELNEVAHLNLAPKEGMDAEDMLNQLKGALKDKGNVTEAGADEEGKLAKLDDGILVELADDWARYQSGDAEFESATVNTMQALIKSMNPQMRKLFNGYVAVRMVPPLTHDPEGVAELLNCATINHD